MRTLAEEVAYCEEKGFHRNTIELSTLIVWLHTMTSEVERYRKGMENWKATAEAKDREFAALRAEVDAQGTFTPNLEGRDFYELCQQYRHARIDAAAEFGALRQYLRDGTLPWPSYETPMNGGDMNRERK